MGTTSGPDPKLAICKYRSRASGYDASARRTFALRQRTIGLLGLSSGERVLDVACGTGLSFPMLREGVGDTGFVTGVDVSADMTTAGRAARGHVGVEERARRDSADGVSRSRRAVRRRPVQLHA